MLLALPEGVRSRHPARADGAPEGAPSASGGSEPEPYAVVIEPRWTAVIAFEPVGW